MKVEKWRKGWWVSHMAWDVTVGKMRDVLSRLHACQDSMRKKVFRHREIDREREHCLGSDPYLSVPRRTMWMQIQKANHPFQFFKCHVKSFFPILSYTTHSHAILCYPTQFHHHASHVSLCGTSQPHHMNLRQHFLFGFTTKHNKCVHTIIYVYNYYLCL